MIAHRHDMCKKWFSGSRIGIQHFDGFAEHIFIANSPYRLKLYLIGTKIILIDYLVTIATKECLHIVEITVTAINELTHIAFLL